MIPVNEQAPETRIHGFVIENDKQKKKWSGGGSWCEGKELKVT